MPGGLRTSDHPDVRIINGGSVLLFVLVTAEARAWVDAHVSEDHQMLGTGLAVEPRYAAALADGMAGDGLIVEHEDGCSADAGRSSACPGAIDDDSVEAIIPNPRQSHPGDRYDLGWLCGHGRPDFATGMLRCGRWPERSKG